MTQKQRLLCKNIFTLTVLIGLNACQRQDPPEVDKISARDIAQIEEFIQHEISTNWNRIAAAGEAIPLQMFVRVGPSTDATVCTTGELYGPYTITNGLVEGEDSISADQPTLRLANLGDLSVCTIITSPVNANLDITADTLYLNANKCKETPANIAGVWEGNYSCTSSCGNQNGFVSLDIQQNEYSATYTDGTANYEGTVCGNIFEFSGEGPGYTEEGTFTLNNDGSASKTSSYQSTIDSCSGTCSDPVLIRGASVVTIAPAETLDVGNCFAFGIAPVLSPGPTSPWGPYGGFIYKDLPAFDLQVGDGIAFDLGAPNDVDIGLDIYMAPTTVNGGTTEAGAFTKIVSNSQVPSTPRGDSIIGNYELGFMAENAFSFSGGGLIIRFSNPSATYSSDTTCTQVLVHGDANDSSGYFVQRISSDADGVSSWDDVDIDTIGSFRLSL